MCMCGSLCVSGGAGKEGPASGGGEGKRRAAAGENTETQRQGNGYAMPDGRFVFTHAHTYTHRLVEPVLVV